jgi:ribosomal protein S18 acetylase RimI-like enzyme
MTIRKMKLPQDIDTAGRASLEAFQYPDHPEWSIQSDEKEGIQDMLVKIKRFWPLLALLRRLSPSFRDIILGYVWEEQGQIAGICMYQRRPGGDYYINNVSVLPAYRRRGIARGLVEAVIAEMHANGVEKALLDVISGNLPAYRLYEKLGFEHFSGNVVLDFDHSELPEKLPLGEGYEFVRLQRRDWRLAYELEKRIVPERVQKYDPVIEGRFRAPFSEGVLDAVAGTRVEKMGVRSLANGQLVARATASYRIRSGGINQVYLRVDPAHHSVAGAFLRHLTRRVQIAAPGRKLEALFPTWLPGLEQAAVAAGFEKRYTYHTMGLLLKTDAISG